MKRPIAGGSGGAVGLEAVLPHPGTSRPTGWTRFLENERLLGDLRRANRFLEAVIDELDSGAIALDEGGVIQAINRPVREYFGVSHDPRGRRFEELLKDKGLDGGKLDQAGEHHGRK